MSCAMINAATTPQKTGHATIKAPPREDTLDHYPVIAGDNSSYLFTVTLCKYHRFHSML
ncbi:MAG: hypothetical protein PHP87_10920 [Syntrophomonas sp.]|uniref:hypothetical protein n=1 Tax=Syntrophomonas sp. TaxID=2053627 RepID=UPI00260C120E|nr:hypothetical protein [Syntrophomonas sp.]MDD4627570.1 hypothetical protein [Syntrophomonas sp.]